MMVQLTMAELCIYILTWNVASHSHKNEISLTSLLSLNFTTNNFPEHKLPDMYVIGLQEVRTDCLFQDSAWIVEINNYLYKLDYVKVKSEQLQGISVGLFVRKQHIPYILKIESKVVRTGLCGLWGNKGAVSIRMNLYDSGIVFVCSHLAAHDRLLKERIEDYQQIVNNTKFNASRYRTIFDHDTIFWFGDLNFRLSGDDTAWDIHNAVKQGKLAELFKLDQLFLLRDMGNAFSFLYEQRPNFPPTYKFFEGSNEYNLKRRPAWCDRILHRCITHKYSYVKCYLEQLSYKSHMDYTISDHKPVSAEFIYKIEFNNDTAYQLHGQSKVF